MKKIVVHEFYMSDVEDIEIYVAEPLYKFEKSEKGQWVMQHALETPVWYCNADRHTFHQKVSVIANLTEESDTYFLLKFSNSLNTN